MSALEESTARYRHDLQEYDRLVRKIERLRSRLRLWRCRSRLELKAARMGLAARAIPY